MGLLEEYVDACSLTCQPARKQEAVIDVEPVRVVGVAVIDTDSAPGLTLAVLTAELARHLELRA